MRIARSTYTRGLAAGIALLLLVACGGEDRPTPGTALPDGGFAPVGQASPPRTHPLLGDRTEVAVDDAGALETPAPEALAGTLSEMAAATAGGGERSELVVDYPLDGSVFPPEFVPPTFLWHDPDPRADTWLVQVEPVDEAAEPMTVLVPGPPPPKGEVDPEAIGPTNEVYRGTDYQNSARSWTPSPAVWEEIRKRSSEKTIELTFTGFASADPAAPLSRGRVGIVTSKDPVGAPFFYRDVPLMPAVGEKGRIKPLAANAIPLIAWRLKDVSRNSSKLVLKGMPACGNCHSFSRDGKTLGMDVDGPDGDKGMYTIKEISKHMVIEAKDTITWNSFPGKLPDHRTIGFLSRISPDGSYVVTTVNESLYVSNFTDYRFLQVFYPAAGILAYYSRAEDEMRALPGADDPEYVHCDPVWTPDGSQLVFARAPVFEPYPVGTPLARQPNDPNEPKVQYDLYRMPFDGGKGGEPVPVEGASQNGMSNTFPKVSPDGKWIVFVKCKNGQLLRPDGRLWIVPFEGGEAREMRCNMPIMNSWHSFSPNGRWMVFSSKSNRPYTQAFLTHIDEDGNDTPAVLVPNCTAANRAVNLPEFLPSGYDSLDSIDVPAVRHHVLYLDGTRLIQDGKTEEGIADLEKALELEPAFSRAHAALAVTLARADRVEEALPHFESAADLDPENPLAWMNLGIARSQTRKGDPCVAFEHAVKVAPGFADAWIMLADSYARRGRAADSVKTYLKAVELAPANEPIRWQLFKLLKALGRDREAIVHLERASELKPEEGGLVARLAWELSTSRADDARNGPRAVELAKRAIDLTKGQAPEPYDALSAAFAEVGNFEQAIHSANRALALVADPSSEIAQQIRRHLKLYREGKTLRQDPPAKTE